MKEVNATEQTWDINIKSSTKWFDINIKELWQYKDLILLFVKRDWETIYKQTLLGPLWAILQPLFMTLVFSVIFGKIAHIPTENTPPLLFYLAGLLPWNYFNTCFSKTSNTLAGNTHLFGKVYFPRLTVPVSYLISGLIGFSINLAIYIIILAFNDYHSKSTFSDILLLPFFFLLTALFSMGLGLIISSLTIKYRDLSFLISFGMQLFMYATPIIYPLSAVPEKYRIIVLLNPLTSITEGFRKSLLGTGSADPNNIIYSSIFILLTFIVGILLFNKSEKSFIDTV